MADHPELTELLHDWLTNCLVNKPDDCYQVCPPPPPADTCFSRATPNRWDGQRERLLRRRGCRLRILSRLQRAPCPNRTLAHPREQRRPSSVPWMNFETSRVSVMGKVMGGVGLGGSSAGSTSRGSRAGMARANATSKTGPYTLHHTPNTQHHTPFPLHSAPCTLHPSHWTLHPSPYTLHPTLYRAHRVPRRWPSRVSLPRSASSNLISQDVLIEMSQRVNSPTKSLTNCLLLIIKTIC